MQVTAMSALKIIEQIKALPPKEKGGVGGLPPADRRPNASEAFHKSTKRTLPPGEHGRKVAANEPCGKAFLLAGGIDCPPTSNFAIHPNPSMRKLLLSSLLFPIPSIQLLEDSER